MEVGGAPRADYMYICLRTAGGLRLVVRLVCMAGEVLCVVPCYFLDNKIDFEVV